LRDFAAELKIIFIFVVSEKLPEKLSENYPKDTNLN